MKKSRLLEIIREEISSALGEAATTYAGKSAVDDLKKDKAFGSLTGDAKADALEKLGSGGTVTIGEEDQLNEEPDFGGRFDKQVAAKYGEEDTLEAATEKITNRVLSDKGITKADVAKMDKKELNSLLKDIRAFISQKKQTPEVAAALKKQTEFDDSGSKLQDNQTNKAILRALGFGSKKGPKGPTKAKAEPKAKAEKSPKAKVATRTPGDDGFDNVSYSEEDDEVAAATKAISGDETAKDLGKTSSIADKFANLFDVKTTEEAKEKMKELAKKANSGDQKAKAFFDDEKNKKIIQSYRKAQKVNA